MLRRLLAVCALVCFPFSAAWADGGDLVQTRRISCTGRGLRRVPHGAGRGALFRRARIDTPYGPIYSPNLTPDKETGIGAWSDDEFYRAMHEGLGKNGEYLYPVFPFPWYTKVTRDDALAIKAYLFTLKPVHAPDKPNGVLVSLQREDGACGVAAGVLPHRRAQGAGAGRKLGRGAYLVEGLGHCGECHNRSGARGASNWSGKYEGGAIQGWYAPNLTSDPKQGIGGWSEDDLVTFLKTGAAPGQGRRPRPDAGDHLR